MEEYLKYIVEIMPALTAVVSLVASLFVSLKKFGEIKQSNIDAINQIAKDLIESNETTVKDNEKIKEANKEMRQTIYDLTVANYELSQKVAKYMEDNGNVRKL